jgi:hypothetical protein
MGEHLFFSDVRRDDESASSLFDRSPLSAGSSASPLLLGKAPAKTMPTARMHVIVRFICAPFPNVFSMKCARASSSDDELINSDKAGMKRGGEARRPSLQELIRMEEASPSYSGHKSIPQDMAVSCCLKEHAIVVLGLSDDSTSISCALKEEPLSISKSPGTGDEERHMAIVPASPTVPISASPRRRALLQALTLRLDIIGRTKGRYRKLDGSCAVSKPELFYQRPIPMGRRCRVQHLEESPYV